VSARAWWALMLATTPDAWARLLDGEQVFPEELDPVWLARAEALQLVRLDARAIDAFSCLLGEEALVA
jgi:hypothetical protein